MPSDRNDMQFCDLIFRSETEIETEAAREVFSAVGLRLPNKVAEIRALRPPFRRTPRRQAVWDRLARARVEAWSLDHGIACEAFHRVVIEYLVHGEWPRLLSEELLDAHDQPIEAAQAIYRRPYETERTFIERALAHSRHVERMYTHAGFAALATPEKTLHLHYLAAHTVGRQPLSMLAMGDGLCGFTQRVGESWLAKEVRRAADLLGLERPILAPIRTRPRPQSSEIANPERPHAGCDRWASCPTNFGPRVARLAWSMLQGGPLGYFGTL
jgi:hypothetical protein